MPGIRTKQDIEKIKKACEITDITFTKTIQAFNQKKFKTEKQVASFIKKTIKDQGGYLAFNTIVASARNSTEIHHKPSSKLNEGFLVIDFGAAYKKYRADMTRTIYLGTPSKGESKLYGLLLKTQKNSIKQLKLNKKFLNIDNYARKQLGKYSQFFTHLLGHGIGTKVHDLPNFKKHRVQNKQTFTIEPGIYIPNKFGIRIEDTILFDKKPIILTKSKKELITLK